MDIVFKRKWEGGHRLIEGVNANGLCSQPHGHTWEVELTLRASPNASLSSHENILSPFETLKKKWHQWIDNHVDHGFMFNSRDPMLNFVREVNPNGRHMVFQGDPTTEVVALAFLAKANSIIETLDVPLKPYDLTIRETQTNSVRVTQEDLAQLRGAPDSWWTRGDMTTC